LSNKNAKEFIDNLLKESIKSLLRYNNKPPNNYLNNNKPKDYFDLNIIFPTIINCSNVYLAVSDIDSEIYTFRLLQKLKDELEDVQIFQFPLMRKLYIDFLAPTLLMEDYIQITSYEPDYSTLRFDNLGNESKSITYHMNKNLNYFSSLRFKHFIFGKEEDDESNRMISFDNSDTLIIDLRFQYLPRKLRIDRIIDEKLYK